MSFAMPPRERTAEGSLRRVGFELEFAGLEPGRTADIVATVTGGRAVAGGPFGFRVENTAHGDWQVELDATVLRDRKYLELLERLGIDVRGVEMLPRIEEWIMRAAGTVVPCEITSPPIPLDNLELIDELRGELQRNEALGTRSRVTFAFGLHINPEAPGTDPGTVLSFLRAFLLLNPWIRSESDIDLARRIAPFIKEFPPAYRQLVLGADYGPGLQQLIDDYLAHNPTRNRPLDLLPLLAHIDEARVRAHAAEPQLLKPRPAFHYRLPNCLIDDPEWRIAHEWRYWVEIERIAGDEARLAAMCAEALRYDESPLPFAGGGWTERVRDWVS